MKKLFKFIVIGLAALIVLGALASIGDEEATVPVEDKVVETAEAEKEPVAKEEPKEEAKLPGKVEYDAVKNGMTREQVEQLFEKVDVISESESEVAGYSSLAVSYKASGDLGANIFIIYMDGIVESKSNFGVK